MPVPFGLYDIQSQTRRGKAEGSGTASLFMHVKGVYRQIFHFLIANCPFIYEHAAPEVEKSIRLMNHQSFSGHILRGLQHAAGIGAVVVGLAVAVGGCGNETLSADAYVAKAEESIAAGDLRAGVIELKNAIQRNPQDPKARLLLARTYLALGDPASAEKEATRARELGAAAQDVLVPLAQAWNDQGAYERTLKELALDDAAPEQHRTNTLVVRGLAHLGLGQLEAAQAHLDEALAATPDDASALVGRARLAMQQKDLEKATSLVDRANAVAPEDAEVVATRGDLALAADRPANAVAAFRTLVGRVPGNLNYKLSLVQAMIANGEAEAAVGTLDEMIRRACSGCSSLCA